MKKKVSLLDTKAIIGYLRDEETFHDEVFEYIRSLEKKGKYFAVILESVLTECVYFLEKIDKLEPAEVADALIPFLNGKGIVNKDKKELISALQIYSKGGMNFVDCLLQAKSGWYYDMPVTSPPYIKVKTSKRKE